jgi:hypothetical protein
MPHLSKSILDKILMSKKIPNDELIYQQDNNLRKLLLFNIKYMNLLNMVKFPLLCRQEA